MACISLGIAALATACGPETSSPGNTAGAAGSAGAGQGGNDIVCEPWSKRDCYTGPPKTKDVGSCAHGFEICNAVGTGFGPCEGELLPAPENCANAADDDCNGLVNDGCVCIPGMGQSCYTGPQQTMGVGNCKAGTQTCLPDGSALGPCEGQVLPFAEDCGTPEDEDCDGNPGCP